MYECVRASVCVCVSTCVRTCVFMCMCARACVMMRVCSFSLDSESPCTLFLSAHTDFNISVDVVVDACVYFSYSLFLYGKSFYNCYKSIWNH